MNPALYTAYLAKLGEVRKALDAIVTTNCVENCYYDAEPAIRALNEAEVLLSLAIEPAKDN